MNSSDRLQEEAEISLFDLWQKLMAGRRYVLGGLALGLLVSVLALASIQARYEALAILQIGQIAGSPVELPQQVVERMKSPVFLLGVAHRIGDAEWAERLNNSHGSGSELLLVQPVKASSGQAGASLIEIKAKSSSVDEAKKLAEAAIALLVERQGELSKPILGKIQNDLAITREKLARTEKELGELAAMTSAAGVKDERFTQLSLITSLRVQKEAEVFSLRERVYSLEISLFPPETQPSQALEGVFVSTKPVSPRFGLVLALGVLGGLLFGVITVFVADAWREARKARAT